MNIFYTSNNLYTAFNDEKEAHNISGDSIFDIYCAASGCLPENFEFSNFSFTSSNFEATWNSDLKGFTIIFDDGKQAQTKAYIEDNRLHTEHDDGLSKPQQEEVNNFVEQVNKIAYHFS